MKKLLTIITFFSVVSTLNAQSDADIMRYESNIFNSYFVYQNKDMSRRRIKSVFQTDAAAYSIYQKARQADIAASITGVAGGFLLGWELDNIIERKQFNPAFYVGCGLSAVSFFMSHKMDKGYARAVEVFNKKVNATQSVGFSTHFGATKSGGIGLELRF